MFCAVKYHRCSLKEDFDNLISNSKNDQTLSRNSSKVSENTDNDDFHKTTLTERGMSEYYRIKSNQIEEIFQINVLTETNTLFY